MSDWDSWGATPPAPAARTASVDVGGWDNVKAPAAASHTSPAMQPSQPNGSMLPEVGQRLSQAQGPEDRFGPCAPSSDSRLHPPNHSSSTYTSYPSSRGTPAPNSIPDQGGHVGTSRVSDNPPLITGPFRNTQSSTPITSTNWGGVPPPTFSTGPGSTVSRYGSAEDRPIRMAQAPTTNGWIPSAPSFGTRTQADHPGVGEPLVSLNAYLQGTEGQKWAADNLPPRSVRAHDQPASTTLAPHQDAAISLIDSVKHLAISGSNGGILEAAHKPSGVTTTGDRYTGVRPVTNNSPRQMVSQAYTQLSPSKPATTTNGWTPQPVTANGWTPQPVTGVSDQNNAPKPLMASSDDQPRFFGADNGRTSASASHAVSEDIFQGAADQNNNDAHGAEASGGLGWDDELIATTSLPVKVKQDGWGNTVATSARFSDKPVDQPEQRVSTSHQLIPDDATSVRPSDSVSNVNGFERSRSPINAASAHGAQRHSSSHADGWGAMNGNSYDQRNDPAKASDTNNGTHRFDQSQNNDAYNSNRTASHVDGWGAMNGNSYDQRNAPAKASDTNNGTHRLDQSQSNDAYNQDRTAGYGDARGNTSNGYGGGGGHAQNQWGPPRNNTYKDGAGGGGGNGYSGSGGYGAPADRRFPGPGGSWASGPNEIPLKRNRWLSQGGNRPGDDVYRPAIPQAIPGSGW